MLYGMLSSTMHKTPLIEGEYYHIYNRGVDKRKVFTNHSEYVRFLAYTYMLNTTEQVSASDFFRYHRAEEAFNIERINPLVSIGAFCLMPNHFHLYITPLVDGGISKFMQRLETAYTKYFNEKHNRTGSLFGGTFKSEHIKSETHAKYLFSYIHLNPAKLKDKNWKVHALENWAPLQEFVEKYQYSSYQEYICDQHLITDPSRFPDYLASKGDITSHIENWLQNRDTAGS